MLWATNTLENEKEDPFSGLVFLVSWAATSHANTVLLPAALPPLTDLS